MLQDNGSSNVLCHPLKSAGTQTGSEKHLSVQVTSLAGPSVKT